MEGRGSFRCSFTSFAWICDLSNCDSCSTHWDLSSPSRHSEGGRPPLACPERVSPGRGAIPPEEVPSEFQVLSSARTSIAAGSAGRLGFRRGRGFDSKEWHPDGAARLTSWLGESNLCATLRTPGQPSASKEAGVRPGPGIRARFPSSPSRFGRRIEPEGLAGRLPRGTQPPSCRHGAGGLLAGRP